MTIRQRTTKLLARRHDLNYFRRGSRLRRWQWGLAAAALVGSVVWFGSSAVLHGSAALSAGPMSSSHAVFEGRCELCHVPVVHVPGMKTASWTPSFLMRKHVPDSACLSCHTAAPHHPQQVAMTPKCSSCHVEHTGAMHLAAAPVAGCVQCHAQLQTKGELKVAAVIHSFATDHPEFRPLRGVSAADRAAALALKFNHDGHMKAGLLGQHGPVTLTCQSCHFGTMSMYGRAMGEMTTASYEKGCRSCHSLEFDTHIAQEAPHADPAQVKAFVETSIADFAREHPEVVTAEIRQWPAEAPLPGKVVLPPPHTQAEWVTNRVRHAETILWREKCSLCHRDLNPESEAKLPPEEPALPKIEPVERPWKWFADAVFSHPAHQAVACAECHTKALTSGNGSDVLMPSIATCRRCHDGESSPQGPALRAGHAESGCSLCHLYHGAEMAAVPVEGRKLGELVGR